MKKILLLPLIVGLAACNNTSITNQKEVDQLKELLNKQDLSDFTSKSFGTMFTQQYDALDVYNDTEAEEKSSSYFSYIGQGFLDSYYMLTKEQYDEIVDEKGDINIFDAIAVGQGGYRITQSAKTTSFFREGGESSVIKNLDISQQMTLKTTAEDVLVYNVLDVADNQIYDYASRQKLNASIDKELLFESISTRSFREIFSRVNLFDSPKNIECLDRLYFSICRDLTTKSNKDISKFIKDNQISIKEVENNLNLSFVFQQNDIDEDYIDNIFPGAIIGTLTFDKVTGSFNEFNYEIKYVNESYDEENGNLRTANMIFTCAGISARDPMGDMWTPDNPTVYDNVVDFLEIVSEEIVPPTILN